MSSLPICRSSWSCWLWETRARPSLVTHTWCLARQSASVPARAGVQESQITAATPSSRATSRRMAQPPIPVRFTPYALGNAALITSGRQRFPLPHAAVGHDVAALAAPLHPAALELLVV